MAYLLFDQDGQKTEMELTEALTTVGRGHEAEVRFRHDRQVSRSHCQIRNKGGVFCLEHVSHKGKTLLNGKAVDRAPVRLSDGDRITVGNNRIVFQLSLEQKPSFFARLGSLFSRG